MATKQILDGKETVEWYFKSKKSTSEKSDASRMEIMEAT